MPAWKSEQGIGTRNLRVDASNLTGQNPDRGKTTYDALFNPGSIAVIGASTDPLKPGGRVLKKIREHGYRGSLWAVNPTTRDVQGVPAFETIKALPGAPDLAIVAIPSRGVIEALQALADKGTRAVIILTAGFGEKDAAGKEMEQRMLTIARAAGMAIIGPNCSGFLTHSYKGKFAGIVPQLPGRAMDMISGSGATVDYVMEMADGRGLSFGMVVNLGNSIQYGVEELVQMYDEHYGPENARILFLYMESMKNPGLLLRHARSLVAKGCAVVAIKSGTTPAGARAAASHTGAMSSSDTAVQALFDKAGIIRVWSKVELIDIACALVACQGPLKNPNICVITDAGGPGVMMADAVFRQGLSMARFQERTLKRLAQILPPEATLTNPIDCLPSRNAERIRHIITIISQEERENVGAIAVLIGNSGMSDNAPIYDAIADAMETSPIPVLPMFTSLATAGEKIDCFRKSGRVYFQDEVSLAAALARIFLQPQAPGLLPELSGPRLSGYDKAAIAAALNGCEPVLGPETVNRLMKAAGFRLPDMATVTNREDLADACSAIGFPLALKVVGPLHKSDVGGVRTGVADLGQARAAYDAMMKIPGAVCVMLQSMVSGTEMILGISREDGFGHLVMFGLGGIYTEVLKDVSFALAPLTRSESLEMVLRIKGVSILKGIRGQEGVSMDQVADNLLRLGLLAFDFPRIKEMDLNPLKGSGKDLYAVDTRVVVDQ